MGETRVSVRDDEADEAVRIIESHREQVGGGLVVPLPQQFAALEARLGYRFRDRGLLEHALTHKSKAHEDPSGGVIDNESLEFLGDAVLGPGRRRRAVPRVPVLQRRAEVEDQGQPGVDRLAGGAGRAARARRPHDPRPRRGEDRRPPQAGAARRHLRGAHRGDLPRRRPRAGARSSSCASSPRTSRTRGTPDYFGRDHKSRLQERLQALGRPLPSYRVAGEVGPDHRKLFHVEVVVGDDVMAQGAGRTKKDAEQEGARAGARDARVADERSGDQPGSGIRRNARPRVPWPLRPRPRDLSAAPSSSARRPIVSPQTSFVRRRDRTPLRWPSMDA